MSHVIYHLIFYGFIFSSEKVVKLVWEGSVINGATPSRFLKYHTRVPCWVVSAHGLVSQSREDKNPCGHNIVSTMYVACMQKFQIVSIGLFFFSKQSQQFLGYIVN